MVAPEIDVPDTDVEVVRIFPLASVGVAVNVDVPMQTNTPVDSHLPDSVCVTLYAPDNVPEPPLQLPVLPFVFQQNAPVPSTVALDAGLAETSDPY